MTLANLTLDQLRDVLYTDWVASTPVCAARECDDAVRRDGRECARQTRSTSWRGGAAGRYQISSLGTVFTALYAAGWRDGAG